MTDKEFEKAIQRADKEIKREQTLKTLKEMNADDILDSDVIEVLQNLQTQWNVKNLSHVIAILLSLYDEHTYKQLERNYSMKP